MSAAITHDLRIEAEAAAALLANLNDILGDDETDVRDAVEGQTNLLEAIGKAVARLGEIAAHVDGLSAHVASLRDRKDRLEKQAENLRTAIAVAMDTATLRRIELPIATVSLKATPPKPDIVSEADIPSKFWKQPAPTLDKRAVLEALKAKEAVPGAVLSNGGMTIQVRFA